MPPPETIPGQRPASSGLASTEADAVSTLSQLLGQRPFMRLWFARLAGTAANQILMVAVGWQMYELTGSAWDLGLIGLYQFVPALLLALPAGQAVDRWHRGRILAACLAVQAVVALALLQASSALWASRELLLGVSLVLGGVRAFQMSAQQALTPLLVPPALLQRAMAFSASAMQAAVIGGPALGGLIYAAGAGAVYASCAVLLALGVMLLLGLRYEHSPPLPEPVTLGTLLAGVHFIRERKVVLGAISLDLFAVLLGGATALLPMFARDILQVGPEGLGLLRAAPAVGALATSVVLSRWPLRRRVGRTLLGAVALFGLCMVVFGLSTSFWLSLLALAVSGAADMVSVVVRQTMVQLETPDAMRGRVGAVNSLFIGASNQLGEFESGATAALLGPVGSVVVGGLGTVLVALLWRRLFPSLARRDGLGA
ncbi:MFS transporter [Ramlibacter sp. 2FC]|uniref:MFS transporter n=1 Tax=Ramlibacter sp. 2FC TaxID=2502188 RepID=UPI0024C443E3|nr:MFS transporter [Ramlibacter sp. 2FC]